MTNPDAVRKIILIVIKQDSLIKVTDNTIIQGTLNKFDYKIVNRLNQYLNKTHTSSIRFSCYLLIFTADLLSILMIIEAFRLYSIEFISIKRLFKFCSALLGEREIKQSL